MKLSYVFSKITALFFIFHVSLAVSESTFNGTYYYEFNLTIRNGEIEKKTEQLTPSSAFTGYINGFALSAGERATQEREKFYVINGTPNKAFTSITYTINFKDKDLK